MGTKTRNGLALFSMSLVFITVSVNLYYLYVGLAGQEIWQCIDEFIFFSSSIIMCLSVFVLFVKVCVFDIFNPLIGLIVFIYFLMWLLGCVAVITADYAHIVLNLALVVTSYIFLTVFTMCITACYKEHKCRIEQIKKDVGPRITADDKPNCYRIRLTPK